MLTFVSTWDMLLPQVPFTQAKLHEKCLTLLAQLVSRGPYREAKFSSLTWCDINLNK